VPSINRAGKEVYYPPGHDTMLQKREEMAAASAAAGGVKFTKRNLCCSKVF